MRLGSMFSGYGGLDMAAQAVWPDLELAWVCDVASGPTKLLAAHHPDVPNLGDISKVDWDQVEPVDVLTGGFPCTDLSSAGRMAGLSGRHSGLWSEMLEAISKLQPRLVVAENVQGLLSGDGRAVPMESCGVCVGDGPGPRVRALGAVLGDLAEIGFDAAWTMLAASDIGAPHQRRRVFLIASHDLVDTVASGDFAPSPPGWIRRQVWPSLDKLPTPVVFDTASMVVNLDPRNGTNNIRREIELANDRDLLRTPLVMEKSELAIRQTLNHDGESQFIRNQIEREPGWPGRFAEAFDLWERLLGRPAPAPLTKVKGKDLVNPELTEWMMGLPLGHLTDPSLGLSWAQQIELCGGGVVPQQGEAAIRELLDMVAAGADSISDRMVVGV